MLSVEDAVAAASAPGAFALWAFPGEDAIYSGDMTVAPYPDAQGLRYNRTCPDMTRDEYLADVGDEIGRLRRRGGRCKTVVARTITGPLPEGGIGGFVERLFSDTYTGAGFRFIFRHPVHGMWAGISPELLVQRDADGLITSMALAGTRPASASGEWDMKNTVENDVVADYIASRLTDLGLLPHTGPRHTVTRGPVSHLCRRITAMAPHVAFDKVAARLSPTPALAGYPVDEAMQSIARIERRPRGCYGGYMAMDHPDGSRRAYVVVRAMKLEEGKSVIYTGSGIMPDSDARAEWEETALKATLMQGLLKP